MRANKANFIAVLSVSEAKAREAADALNAGREGACSKEDAIAKAKAALGEKGARLALRDGKFRIVDASPAAAAPKAETTPTTKKPEAKPKEKAKSRAAHA